MLNENEDVHTLKALVIGAGNIFQNFHLPVFKNLKIEVVCVIDPSTIVREKLQQELIGVKFCNTISEVEMPFDFALIASPTRFHAEQLTQLLKFKKPVFCEKPIATTSAEAKKISSDYAQLSVPLQIGFYRRFQPSTQYVKRVVQEETFGKLRRVVAFGGWIPKGSLPLSILDKRLSGGGITLDYGVHFIDTLQFWLGELLLQSYYDDSKGGIEMSAKIELKTKSQMHDILICIYLSWNNIFAQGIRLFFDDAMIFWGINSPFEIQVVKYNHQAQSIAKTVEIEMIGLHDDSMMPPEKQWRTFLTRIQTGASESFPVSLSEAITSTQIVEECYQNRKPLNLNWGF